MITKAVIKKKQPAKASRRGVPIGRNGRSFNLLYSLKVDRIAKGLLFKILSLNFLNHAVIIIIAICHKVLLLVISIHCYTFIPHL